MAHVRFEKPFLWRASPRVWIDYPAGHIGSVTRACADAALAAGVAKPVRTPNRSKRSDG